MSPAKSRGTEMAIQETVRLLKKWEAAAREMGAGASRKREVERALRARWPPPRSGKRFFGSALLVY
jgi:hypothetical protein